MPKINKAYATWALCGYLTTTLTLAIFIELIEYSVIQRFGLFTALLAIPFILALFLVEKFFDLELKNARTPYRAACRGICSGGLLVTLVSLFACIGGLFHSLIVEGNPVVEVGTMLTALVTVTFVALIYSAIPILIFGTALGLSVYSKNRVN